jgi:hypothetical protein
MILLQVPMELAPARREFRNGMKSGKSSANGLWTSLGARKESGGAGG